MGRTARTPCDYEDCDRSPINGDPLFRVNPKGEIGIFMCREHADNAIKVRMSTYADQQILADESNGIIGDCWRACIASLLGVPIASVPHFVKDHDARWLNATRDWLHTHHSIGLRPTRLPADSALFGKVILVGTSPRERSHAVIADTAGEMLHDPHPTRAGLTCVSEVYMAVQL